MNPEQPIVAVFGANDPREGHEAYELARAVGRRLAELGYIVANGGYAGTMEAAARGAKEAGGFTLGVTCSLWKSKANTYIDQVIQTADLYSRVRKLIELGEGGYVVLPGATGTLVELSLVWELMAKGFLPPRPLVCLGGFWRPLIEMMSRQRPRALELIAAVESPSELSRYFRQGSPRGLKQSLPGGGFDTLSQR